MVFKIFFLIICSASLLEAIDSIPLKKVVSKKNYYKPGGYVSKIGETDVYHMNEGGLIMDITINGTGVPFLLNSIAPEMWVISEQCRSKFCITNTSKIQEEVKCDKNKPDITGLVEGCMEMVNCTLLNQPTFDITTLVATEVSNNVAKCIGKSSGVIPLFDKTFWSAATKPVGQLYICFSSDENIRGLSTERDDSILTEHGEKTHYLKSSPNKPWNVAINYISLGLAQRKMISTAGKYATIDTTFNAISGPTKDINFINSIIGTDENGVIDCKRVPFLDKIVFHFGSYGYPLLPKDYIVKNDDPFDFRQCKSAFVPDDNNQWRMGLPFLARYVMKLDVESSKIALYQLQEKY